MLNRAVGLAISVADLAGVHITFGQDDTRVDSRAVLIDIHGRHQAVGFITLAAGCGPLPSTQSSKSTGTFSPSCAVTAIAAPYVAGGRCAQPCRSPNLS